MFACAHCVRRNEGFAWIFYLYQTGSTGATVITDTKFAQILSMRASFYLQFAVYTLNGTFLGATCTKLTAPFLNTLCMRAARSTVLYALVLVLLSVCKTGSQRWVDGLVQLCEDKFQNLNGSIYFGTLYSQNCTISSSRLNNWPLLFYELCTPTFLSYPTFILRLEYCIVRVGVYV